jgi:hypothetical protein
MYISISGAKQFWAAEEKVERETAEGIEVRRLLDRIVRSSL